MFDTTGWPRITAPPEGLRVEDLPYLTVNTVLEGALITPSREAVAERCRGYTLTVTGEVRISLE